MIIENDFKKSKLKTLLQERLHAPYDKELDENHFNELEALLSESEVKHGDKI
jgi:hypothetical protein